MHECIREFGHFGGPATVAGRGVRPVVSSPGTETLRIRVFAEPAREEAELRVERGCSAEGRRGIVPDDETPGRILEGVAP